MKIRKGQKCWLCKKEIKGDFCYNGHYWHPYCKKKDTLEIIEKFKEKNSLFRAG